MLYLIISKEPAPLDTIENFLLIMGGLATTKGGINEHQPRKLKTKKWSTTEPTTKSANALHEPERTDPHQVLVRILTFRVTHL
jgi:hypothetical protein